MSVRRRRHARWARVTAAALALAGALAVSPPAGAAASAAPGASAASAARPETGPAAAVTERLADRARTARTTAATKPRVQVTRRSGDWAFGTAVLATEPGSAPLPQGWLFLAERDDGRWTAALEGERAFAALARRAPLVEGREQALLAAQDGSRPEARRPEARGAADRRGTFAAGGDFRTGMALPTTADRATYMTSGPHGWSGAAAPWSSLDFAGGDEAVRAARQGTAYTMCRGWIRVVHDRGYATDYYHLWNHIDADGAAVNTGTYLGDTGTDVTCGGSATGRHVHFALRQNGDYVGVAGHALGRWVFFNGGGAYQGHALLGSRQVGPGGALHHHGALGFTQGVIDTFGGTHLNKRTGPGTGHGLAGTVADGATVDIACSADGTSHTGRYGTTSLWNRLSDGTWVSDAYLWTGVSGPVNGWC
ncbi:peptidoglycan DD-metalloendopeptidase family protein [Streptomyces sp. DSM 42041]|uniref:Peptidoglycan DD-metalloendopeptidase family protein n=1 Tax=Streptomyces hazeniae TaxID=3075538 RepID=A0ABU2NSG6_9ACTN|nr:peptidoglycan DD-metalloendopeptidase family protein [Streptomyces sp. DSM 42041]MDT0379925.1 peptidoglycan DD-metalloendopeptidase family protein [Streptomyces sp. DSM 42041]